jgi:hypothetical protein
VGQPDHRSDDDEDEHHRERADDNLGLKIPEGARRSLVLVGRELAREAHGVTVRDVDSDLPSSSFLLGDHPCEPVDGRIKRPDSINDPPVGANLRSKRAKLMKQRMPLRLHGLHEAQ